MTVKPINAALHPNGKTVFAPFPGILDRIVPDTERCCGPPSPNGPADGFFKIDDRVHCRSIADDRTDFNTPLRCE